MSYFATKSALACRTAAIWRFGVAFRRALAFATVLSPDSETVSELLLLQLRLLQGSRARRSPL